MLKKLLTLLFPLPEINLDLLVLDIKQEVLFGDCQLISFFDYKDEEVKKLIIRLKEHQSNKLRKEIARIIIPEFEKVLRASSLYKNTVQQIYLVPVPARKERLEEFGFNQTELFCNALALVAEKRLVVKNVLTRIIEVSKQAHKNKQEREQEIEHTMKCTQKIPADKAEGSVVIIVDDVATTGATMREARRALLDSGAQQVLLVSLARA